MVVTRLTLQPSVTCMKFAIMNIKTKFFFFFFSRNIGWWSPQWSHHMSSAVRSVHNIYNQATASERIEYTCYNILLSLRRQNKIIIYQLNINVTNTMHNTPLYYYNNNNIAQNKNNNYCEINRIRGNAQKFKGL